MADERFDVEDLTTTKKDKVKAWCKRHNVLKIFFGFLGGLTLGLIMLFKSNKKHEEECEDCGYDGMTVIHWDGEIEDDEQPEEAVNE